MNHEKIVIEGNWPDRRSHFRDVFEGTVIDTDWIIFDEASDVTPEMWRNIVASEEKKFFDMDSDERFEDLRERVNKFSSLELPGQPMGMHMGTSYLVNDLWREFEKLQTEIKRLTAALDALARFGNEPHFGNSDGNMIARAALEKSGGE